MPKLDFLSSTWIGNVNFHSFFFLCKPVADPQSLLEEKEALDEKLAISEYELRLAREDILKLRAELQKKLESSLAETNGRTRIFSFRRYTWFVGHLLYCIPLHVLKLRIGRLGRRCLMSLW